MLLGGDQDRSVQHLFRQFTYLASNGAGVRQTAIVVFQPLEDKVGDEAIAVDSDQLLLSRTASPENAKFALD
jgi:hypothetical protein